MGTPLSCVGGEEALLVMPHSLAPLGRLSYKEWPLVGTPICGRSYPPEEGGISTRDIRTKKNGTPLRSLTNCKRMYGMHHCVPWK